MSESLSLSELSPQDFSADERAGIVCEFLDFEFLPEEFPSKREEFSPEAWARIVAGARCECLSPEEYIERWWDFAFAR